MFLLDAFATPFVLNAGAVPFVLDASAMPFVLDAGAVPFIRAVRCTCPKGRDFAELPTPQP